MTAAELLAEILDELERKAGEFSDRSSRLEYGEPREALKCLHKAQLCRELAEAWRRVYAGMEEEE